MAKTKDKVEKVTSNLNEKQKLFCNYYLGLGHTGTRGNATQSYWDVYMAGIGKKYTDENGNEKIRFISQRDPVTQEFTSEYYSASANGARLIGHANIQAYIKEKTLHIDINKEISKTVMQEEDLTLKLRACELIAKMTNQLNQTINIPQLDQVSKDIKNVLETFKK